MKVLLLSFLLAFHSALYAEIPRELKEQLGKDLQGDEEFKRAFVYFAETADRLYDAEIYENKEKFNAQYEKYVKSSLCMQFLATPESASSIKAFAQKLELIQRKSPGYKKVQTMMTESGLTHRPLAKTPLNEGHQFCSFKISSDRIQKKSGLPVTEKINLITKNNVLLTKAMNAILADFTEYYTSSKLSEKQRGEFTKKAVNGLICALYFTSEDQYEPVMKLISSFEDELKTKAGFNTKLESLQIDMNPAEQAKAIDGDPALCAFKMDAEELAKHKTRKTRESEAAADQYARLLKLLNKSHPKIKLMAEAYEKNFEQMIPDKEMARKMFIKNFPNYLDQMNQDVSLNLQEMMKNPVCQKKVASLTAGCAGDERFALVKEHKYLLILMCNEEHKSQISAVCSIK